MGMNSRRRAYCSYGIGPYFTRESGNLSQRDTRKTTGYVDKTVGLGQIKPKHGEGVTYSLVMKKRKKIRKPSSMRVDCQVVMGSRSKVKKQIEAQTKFRLYRGDLSRLAQRRVFKIQQIRAEYRKFLRKEAAADDDSDDEDDDNKKTANEDLVEVD